MKPRLLHALLLLFLAPAAHAHVGSKDVFETVHAGPYELFVTIRPPDVIPGIATVEVRATGPAVSAIHITPIPLTGEASLHPPKLRPHEAFYRRPRLLHRLHLDDGLRLLAGSPGG